MSNRVSKMQESPSALERAVRTVLVVDIVDSVRLIEENEHEAISRWRSFVTQVEQDLLPKYGGRLVKSLGDGMLLDFPHVAPAVQAAFAMQGRCATLNAGVEANRLMLLRMGMQVGELIVDEHDVYGRGVNLAARLTTIAGPGEIVVSAGVRDHLTPVLDADIEDLGDVYLKNVRQPVRAFRLGPPGPRPVIDSDSASELRPTLAVIPFVSRSSEPEHLILGEVLADEVISVLSQTSDLNVISRLSTTAFRGRDTAVSDVGAHLSASYVLSGRYHVSRNQLKLTAELSDTKSGLVAWAKDLRGNVAGITKGKDDIIDRIVVEVSTAIVLRELQRAQSRALPTLESYTLLMGAIALMHRLSSYDFQRAHEMLQALTERARRQAVPHAWLAKWHVLRVQQGWSNDRSKDAQLALDCTKRALDADPACSLALAVDGFVHTNLLKDLDVGLERYELAIHYNPNDALAWLLKGTLHAFRGEGDLAVRGTQRARKLSPLDPHRYFFDSLSSTAHLAAGRYERAVELAQRSLRANRTHTSTWRALAIAQWQLRKYEDARKSVAELMKLEPTLTVHGYLERNPSAAYATGKMWSSALRDAGVPQ